MKKFLILLIIFWMMQTINLKSQDEDLDKLDFEMQDYEQFEEETTPYFVIGGGPIINLTMINYAEINNIISGNGFFAEDKLEGLFFQWGGQGIIAIGIIPNLRIGVIGMGGTKSINKDMENIQLDAFGDTLKVKVNRFFNFNAGFTGINIDYAFVPFTGIKFAVVPGVIAGWGQMSMESFQTETGNESLTLEDDFKLDAMNINYSTKLETSYLYLAPMLNLEYSPTILAMFRGSVGYSMSFLQEWNLNGNPDATIDLTDKKIGVDGLTIQIGVIFGLFNY